MDQTKYGFEAKVKAEKDDNGVDGMAILCPPAVSKGMASELADAIYPGDKVFLGSVKATVEDWGEEQDDGSTWLHLSGVRLTIEPLGGTMWVELQKVEA